MLIKKIVNDDCGQQYSNHEIIKEFVMLNKYHCRRALVAWTCNGVQNSVTVGP